MITIIEGSLEEIEGCNGFYLYGTDVLLNEVFLGALGTEPLGYDPNDDPEIPEAYDFIVY